MPVTFSSPYPDHWQFALKGNIHTHTTVSDGKCSMQAVADDYAARGYDFLMFSDHDKYGDVDAVDGHGMILIPGVEVSANGPHMLQVGVSKLVTPDADRQKVIDAVSAVGGFTIANHPNWQEHYNHFPQEMLESLSGYSGVEIYNGCIRRIAGSPLATDRWDRLLAKGRKFWGHGVDDSHRPKDVGNAWDVALVNERTSEAILEALRNGSFYASTGVVITDIRSYGEVLRVAAPNAEKILVIREWGRIVAESWGSELIYRWTPDVEGYVRVECYGRGDTMAWTQPFFVEGIPASEETSEAGEPEVKS